MDHDRPLREGVGRNPQYFKLFFRALSRPLREGVGRNFPVVAAHLKAEVALYARAWVEMAEF